MGKHKAAKHIYRIDKMTAYSRAGACIEDLDSAKLKKELKGDVASLNSVVRGKSLLDLALDNIEYVIQEKAEIGEIRKVCEIIDILMESEAIEKDAIREDAPALLFKLADKIGYCHTKKIKLMNLIEVASSEYEKAKAESIGLDDVDDIDAASEKIRARKKAMDDIIVSSKQEIEALTMVESYLAKAVSEKISTVLPEEINNPVKDSYSMLHIACLNGQTELAKQLLEKGADPFASSNGLTPVHMLALSRHKEVAIDVFQEMQSLDFKQKMQEEQAKPNGFMYSMMALKGGNLGLAEEFSKMAADSKQIQAEVFYRAVKHNDVELVKNLFNLDSSKASNLTFVKRNGKTIDLLRTSLEGDGEAFKAIMESGNKHIKAYGNLFEKYIGDPEVIDALLKYSKSEDGLKLDINAPRQKGNLLNWAYNAKQTLEDENIRLARDHEDGKPNKKEIKSKIVANNRQIASIYESINKLLRHNVDGYYDAVAAGLKPRLFDVNTAFKVDIKAGEIHRSSNVLIRAYNELYLARCDKAESPETENIDARVDNLQKVFSNILDHPGADLNIADENGRSLLMLAAQYGDEHTVGRVVFRESKKSKEQWLSAVNAVDSMGNTALFYAAQSGKLNTFELLVDEGAILRKDGRLITNNAGITPLMAACGGGHFNVIEYIEPTAKDISQLDNKGNGVLHYLAMGSVGERVDGQKEANVIMEKLFTVDAKIDAKNKEGKTPLILAVINNNVDLVNELLRRGADINLPDNDGNTPLIYACLLNNSAMITRIMAASNLDINHKNNAGVSAFLVSAQRDGLEGGSEDVREKMGRELGAEVYAKIQDVPGLYDENSYTGLTSALQRKGADLCTSDPVNMTNSMATVGCMIAVAKGANVVSQVVAGALPGYGGIASEVVKAVATVTTAAVTRHEVKKVVKTGFMGLFNNVFGLDEKLPLDGEILIGNIDDKGFTTKHGASYKKYIQDHPNFKNTDAIYMVSDLQKVIKADNDNSDFKDVGWYVRAHDTLTDQYKAIQVKIEDQPWYYTFPFTWKGSALKKVAKEILDADEELKKDGNKGEEFLKIEVEVNGRTIRKTFEEVYGGDENGLLSIIKSPKASKKLLNNIVSYRDRVAPLTKEEADLAIKIKETEQLIDDVVNRKIAVAPDTYLHFVKFVEEKNIALGQGPTNKQAFLQANKESLLEMPDSKPLLAAVFIENKEKVVEPIPVIAEKPVEGEGIYAQAKGWMKVAAKWAAGAKSNHELRKKAHVIADTAAEVVADIAAVGVGLQATTEGKVVAVKAGAAGLEAVTTAVKFGGNFLSFGGWLAGAIWDHKEAAVATALVTAGATVLYQNRDAIQSAASDAASSVYVAATNAASAVSSPFAGEEEVGLAIIKDLDAASGIDISPKVAITSIEGMVEGIKLEGALDGQSLAGSIASVMENASGQDAIGMDDDLELFHDAKEGPDPLTHSEKIEVADVTELDRDSLGSVMGLPDDDHEHSSPLSEKGLIPDDMHTAEEALVVPEKVKPKVHNVGEVVEKEIGKDVAADMEKESGVERSPDVVSQQ